MWSKSWVYHLCFWLSEKCKLSRLEPATSKSIKTTGSCSNNSMSLGLLTAFSWFSQPSPTALEQYMGLCAIVIIQGRCARFSGLLASCKHKQPHTFCTCKSNWKLSSAMQLKINSTKLRIRRYYTHLPIVRCDHIPVVKNYEVAFSNVLISWIHLPRILCILIHKV